MSYTHTIIHYIILLVKMFTEYSVVYSQISQKLQALDIRINTIKPPAYVGILPEYADGSFYSVRCLVCPHRSACSSLFSICIKGAAYSGKDLPAVYITIPRMSYRHFISIHRHIPAEVTTDSQQYGL